MPTVGEAFPSLSVVIPAYNAAQVIATTLESLRSYLGQVGVDYEIVVVDDGSTDETLRKAEGPGVVVLHHHPNRGKGYAVRRGMLASSRAWVLFTDVDNATPIEHLDRFAAFAGQADVLIASRRLTESQIVRRQPFVRQVLGRTFPYLVRLLTLPTISDTQCGFKVFRREVIQPIFSRQSCTGFCFDVEVLLVARRLGRRIIEVPVDWDNPHPSTVRMLRDPLRMLRDLLLIVWRHRASKYSQNR